MLIAKVTQRTTRGKPAALMAGKSAVEYDHYIAIDWSLRTMAIAHISRGNQIPRVFERPTDLKELKTYLGSLKGRTIITFEESGAAHWLFLELVDCADRILICDPFQNRLLFHGPKTDKIDARKLCELLRSGLLKEVYHSDSALYELRLLVSGFSTDFLALIRVDLGEYLLHVDFLRPLLNFCRRTGQLDCHAENSCLLRYPAFRLFQVDFRELLGFFQGNGIEVDRYSNLVRRTLAF